MGSPPLARPPITLGSRKVAPEALKWARARLDLSQRELAPILGVHPNTINRWEQEGAPLYIGYAIPGLLLAKWRGEALEEYLDAAQDFLFRQGDLLDLTGGDNPDQLGEGLSVDS